MFVLFMIVLYEYIWTWTPHAHSQEVQRSGREQVREGTVADRRRRSSDDAEAVATMAIVFPREWLARESFAQDLLGVFLAIFAVLFTVLVLMSRKRSSSTATPAATPAAAKKKVAKVDEFPNGPLVILWGSQTGTAEGFGKTLAREARQRGFKARSIDLEDYEPDELAEEEAPVVFLMATHGERPRSTLV